MPLLQIFNHSALWLDSYSKLPFISCGWRIKRKIVYISSYMLFYLLPIIFRLVFVKLAGCIWEGLFRWQQIDMIPEMFWSDHCFSWFTGFGSSLVLAWSSNLHLLLRYKLGFVRLDYLCFFSSSAIYTQWSWKIMAENADIN